MTQEAKLKKIIEKAVEGGYKRRIHNISFFLEGDNYFAFLFSQSFAKSIWGEERVELRFSERNEGNIAWEYHIRNAVISEDPISYYYENL